MMIELRVCLKQLQLCQIGFKVYAVSHKLIKIGKANFLVGLEFDVEINIAFAFIILYKF